MKIFDLPIIEGTKIQFCENEKSAARFPIIGEYKSSGCVECVSHTQDSGGYFSINRIYGRSYLHRFIFAKYNEPIPAGYIVRHTCDNTKCINPEHLILGHHEDNVQDRVLRGRTAVGEKHGNHKLTLSQVREIKFFSTLSRKQLAEKFQVSVSAIKKIRTCKLWKHVILETQQKVAA